MRYLSSMEKIITHIIKNKIPCYFLSPHLDDAVLSAGGLISTLSGKTNIIVVNIFTKAGKSSTLSGRKATQRAGFSTANAYYNARIKEDRAVLLKMKAKIVNLDIPEALWREKYKKGTISKYLGRYFPEALMIYPTFRFHILGKKVSAQDSKTVDLIDKKLSFIEKGAYVFAPIGVGDHIDHTLTFHAAEKFENVIFWSDFPYNLRTSVNIAGEKKYVFKTNWSLKDELVKMYKTQYNLLFPSGKMPRKNEVFFTNI